MTIRDFGRIATARTLVAAVAASVAAGGLLACGQRGPLRLMNDPAGSTRTPAVAEPGGRAASAVDARDPFSNPSPTAAPASVPRP